ncbi:hypothetical protein GQ473_01845, partial [archaeon]|nr:hypothetical protein [archaeon]
SCGGLGSGTELNFRVNFNTNGTEIALLHDITINYSTQQISGELISKNMTLNSVLLSWTGTKLENITMYVSDDNTTWVGPISNDYTTNSSWDALYYKTVFVYDGTSPELDSVTVMRGDVLTQNPRASINGNADITHTGTLTNGATATINMDSNNFTVGQNNIIIYTDAGLVDYAISMNCLSAIVSNTGMNNVTVKQVIVFKTDGTNCILQNNETTFDVGEVFSVSGCPMSCNEFTSIKAYTDCTGVYSEFSRRPSGC